MQHCMWGRLLQMAAGLDADRDADRAALRVAAAAFRSNGNSDVARELLNKLGDHKVCLCHLYQISQVANLVSTYLTWHPLVFLHACCL